MKSFILPTLNVVKFRNFVGERNMLFMCLRVQIKTIHSTGGREGDELPIFFAMLMVAKFIFVVNKAILTNMVLGGIERVLSFHLNAHRRNVIIAWNYGYRVLTRDVIFFQSGVWGRPIEFSQFYWWNESLTLRNYIFFCVKILRTQLPIIPWQIPGGGPDTGSIYTRVL